MTVGELRSKLVPLDDDLEIYLAPEMDAERVGENRQMKVPHPLHHYPVTKFHIISDVDTADKSLSDHRVVLAFDQNCEKRNADERLEIPRTATRSC